MYGNGVCAAWVSQVYGNGVCVEELRPGRFELVERRLVMDLEEQGSYSRGGIHGGGGRGGNWVWVVGVWMRAKHGFLFHDLLLLPVWTSTHDMHIT